MLISSWMSAFSGAVIGILAARWSCPSRLVVAAVLLLLFISGFLKKNRHHIWPLVLLLFFYGYYHLRVTPLIEGLPALPEQSWSGTVSQVRVQNERTDFILHTEHQNSYLRKIKVYAYCPLEIEEQDRVKLYSALTTPSGRRNPGEFDYPRYLADQSIFYQAKIKQSNQLKILAKTDKNVLDSYRITIKNSLNEKLPPAEAQLLQAMLLGDKTDLEPELYSSFQKIGLVHWFAVSGLHIGFLLLLCGGLGTLFGWGNSVRLVVSLVVMFSYATLIGWPISVRRAVIMGTLALVAVYTGRRQQLSNSLGLAGIIILLINPVDLFRISFQLSFTATWGLIALFPAFKDYFSITSKWGDLFLVPLCAQLATLPLSIFYFNIFSPVALISNIFLTYILAAVVLLAFCGLFFPFCAVWFWWPAGALLEMIMPVGEFLGNIPGGWWWVGTPEPELIVVFYALLVGLLQGFRKYWNLKVLYSISTAMVLWAVLVSLPAGFLSDGKLQICFLDVGQGDAILLKSPDGYYMLVDGGGSRTYDVGEKTVFPYLVRHGIRNLEWAINTHPDTDHLQGIETVATKLPGVEHIGIPSLLKREEVYDKLINTARQRDIKVVPVKAGERFYLGEEIVIDVLAPSETEKIINYNEASLILLVRYQDFSLLLAGDLGKEKMEQLLRDYDLTTLTAVKIPHHGSAYSWSDKFYQKVSPRFAVIQVGRNNPFNHPAQTVLEGLKKCGTVIYRNDLHGAIFMETDGKTLKVKAFL